MSETADHMREESTGPGAGMRACDHPDCVLGGEHRAPKSPQLLRDYYWFCLAHVREYNAAWNFCAGMTQDEVDSAIRNDVVWGRPTWPLGMMGGRGLNASRGFDDPMGVFEAGEEPGERHRREQAQRQAMRGPNGRHYRALKLKPPVSLTALKARYKELAKRLHPDLNGGDKDAEERLKEINAAYAALKKVAIPNS